MKVRSDTMSRGLEDARKQGRGPMAVSGIPAESQCAPTWVVIRGAPLIGSSESGQSAGL